MEHTTDTSAGADPYGWDERVEAWDEVAETDAFRALRDRISELADPQPNDRVLDLGAGTGLVALALAPRVAELVALDIAPRMLERLDARAAAEGIDNVVPVVGDLRRLPFEDESFTLVVSNYAFHHVDDAAKELALTEARRVLVPGGRLVVCDMMFSLSLGARDRRVIWEKVSALARRGPAGLLRIARNAGRVAAGRWEQPATPEVWERMLAERGFEEVRVEALAHESGMAVARRPLLDATAGRARGGRAGASGRRTPARTSASASR